MSVPSRLRIRRQTALLLAIDIQPGFVDRMHGDLETYLRRLEQLFLFAQAYDIPLAATFEDERKRKETAFFPLSLEQVFSTTGTRWMKRYFDFCDEIEFDRFEAEVLKFGDPETEQTGRQIVVAGGETDVCVLQTVLGLLERGFQVFTLDDCLYSSAPDTSSALERLRLAGAIPTSYKSFYHEITEAVGEGPMIARMLSERHPHLPALIDPEKLSPGGFE